MNVDTMRGEILNMYPGSKSWVNNVCTMTDKQVIAIYLTSYEKRMRKMREEKELSNQICMFFSEREREKEKEREDWLERYGDLYE